jgi:hypothetical protein
MIEHFDGGGTINNNIHQKHKPTFDEWYNTIPSYKNDTNSYSLREAYNNLPYSDMVKFSTTNGHLPDTYKKPSHPTFSVESKYNSELTPGGKWSYHNGHDRFSPSYINIINLGGPNNYQKWFSQHEPDVELDMSDYNKTNAITVANYLSRKK